MEDTEEQNPRLTKHEVIERLNLCESPEIVKQLYDFGLTFSKELLDRIKALKTKATSLAAYGAAIVSFLVATSASWSSVGNLSSKWIVLFAGVCGLICNVHAVRVLRLVQTEAISQDD